MIKYYTVAYDYTTVRNYLHHISTTQRYECAQIQSPKQEHDKISTPPNPAQWYTHFRQVPVADQLSHFPTEYLYGTLIEQDESHADWERAQKSELRARGTVDTRGM